MECRTTSTSRRRTERALTLIEMIVASAIGSVVAVALASLTVFSARSVATLTNYVDLDQYSRKALDRMVMEFRQADRLHTYAADRRQVIFNINGGTSNLSYTYSTNTLQLVRRYQPPGGALQTEILLTNCTALNFYIYTSTPLPGTFDQFQTSTASEAKLIKVDWTCTRRLYGTTNLNTESIQSAKIVIRKS